MSLSLLKSDFKSWTFHNRNPHTIGTFLKYTRFYPEFRALIAFRLRDEKWLKPLAVIMRYSCKYHNLHICTQQIGSGFRPFHAFSTIIFAKSIGREFCVFQNVTIGYSNGENPVIGNNVTIYTGSIVLGGVKIGDNVIVGAGSVVNKDVPNDTMVVGNPAIIIKKYNRITNKWEKISHEKL